MDSKSATALAVHRCRFVDYAPSAITALAFPPLPLPSLNGKKKSTAGKQPLRDASTFGLLAVGHANGNIDLCEWMGSGREPSCSQSWVVRKVLPGPYPSKVDSLVFATRYPEDISKDGIPKQSDLRLFSSGGGSELLEWDLERGCIRRTISSQGGSIWSIAANPSCTSLALGCEDGTVRILNIANDTLTHSRRFDRVKCRMLSIAWGPPVPRVAKPKPTATQGSGTVDEDDSEDDDEDEWTDSWLVTGGSDSSLRKWDVATGRALERMGVDKIRGERTLVWTVGVLGDGTIVSGDSLGSVKFWDSRTCTQLYSFQAHGADVLCMTISPEGKALYTSGVDQKITQFSLVKTSSDSSSSSRILTSKWTQTSSRRMHTHDVRALAIWPPYSSLPPSSSSLQIARHPLSTAIDVAPILVSGGLDMSVILTPAALPTSTVVKITNPLETSQDATFEDAYHRKLSYVGKGKVKVARSAKLVSCVREAGLSIWRVKGGRGRELLDPSQLGKEAVKGNATQKTKKKKKGKQADVDVDMSMNVDLDLAALDDNDPDSDASGSAGWERVLEMELNVHSNITAHEISDDGKWLAVSDLYESKLFLLSGDGENVISSEAPKINPKRSKEFSAILQSHIPQQTSGFGSAQIQSTGASAFAFSPDSSKLVLSTALSGYILVLDLTGEKPKVLRRFEHHRLAENVSVVSGRNVKGKARASNAKKGGMVNGHVAVNGDVEMADVPHINGASSSGAGSASEDESASGQDAEDDGEESDSSSSDDDVNPAPKTVIVSIDQMAISTDGQWLATSDNHGRTHVFNLDSVSHHTVLPTFHRPAQCLVFDPVHPSVLLLVFPDNTIQVYDVETRQFPAWGKELAASLPKKFTDAHEVVLGAAFDSPGLTPSEEAGEGDRAGKTRYILFWSATWIFKASLDTTAWRAGSGGGRSRKRRRDKEGNAASAAVALSASALAGELDDLKQWRDFKMVAQYRPILCCSLLSREELLVAERPLVDVLMTLPPAYFKHKYGAT